MGYFDLENAIAFEGADSQNPLAFRHYQADELILGKPMREHLRFAVCYWHNLVWGRGGRLWRQCLPRSWNNTSLGDPMDRARAKADAAFELFDLLGSLLFVFMMWMHGQRVIPLRKVTATCAKWRTTWGKKCKLLG